MLKPHKLYIIMNTLLSIDCFSMTDSEDECVMALKTDPLDKHLVTGDTLGVISVFDIRNFCTTPHKQVQ